MRFARIDHTEGARVCAVDDDGAARVVSFSDTGAPVRTLQEILAAGPDAAARLSIAATAEPGKVLAPIVPHRNIFCVGKNYAEHAAELAKSGFDATGSTDGQHLPEELPALLKPIIADEADHVNGSRMLGDYERGPLVRHVCVHFFSWIVTVLTGQRVTDISSGYRATRADTLRRLILEQDQFWTSEVTIEALRQHARVTEVPVTFLTRRGGESKKPKSLRYGWNLTKAIAKTWLR